MKIESTHKALTGTLDEEPFFVSFVGGVAEVEEAVGEYLLRLRAASRIVEERTEEDETAEDISNLGPLQLKKFARDHGIDVGSATKKADLISAINKARGID